MTKDEKSTGYIEEEKVIQSVGYREFAFGKVYSSLNEIGLFSDKNQKIRNLQWTHRIPLYLLQKVFW